MPVEIEIRGINGAGDQVFRGNDDAELVQKLAKAQENATKLIRKQAKQIATLTGLLADAVSDAVMEKMTGREKSA